MIPLWPQLQVHLSLERGSCDVESPEPSISSGPAAHTRWRSRFLSAPVSCPGKITQPDAHEPVAGTAPPVDSPPIPASCGGEAVQDACDVRDRHAGGVGGENPEEAAVLETSLRGEVRTSPAHTTKHGVGHRATVWFLPAEWKPLPTVVASMATSRSNASDQLQRCRPGRNTGQPGNATHEASKQLAKDAGGARHVHTETHRQAHAFGKTVWPITRSDHGVHSGEASTGSKQTRAQGLPTHQKLTIRLVGKQHSALAW